MSDQEFKLKFLEQLGELGDHYRRFTRWVSLGFVILFASNLWFVFVALPRKNDQIQQSRSQTLRQVCEDEKTLLTLVPPGFEPRPVDPGSALNPRRDCGQYVLRMLR